MQNQNTIVLLGVVAKTSLFSFKVLSSRVFIVHDFLQSLFLEVSLLSKGFNVNIICFCNSMLLYYDNNSLPANPATCYKPFKEKLCCSFYAKHVEGPWFLFWVNENEWSSNSSVCWFTLYI